MHVRLLTAQDGPQYQALRLQALQTDPGAFLTTLESEQNRHEVSFGDELDYAYAPPTFGFYGVFDTETAEQKLLGFCQVLPSYLPKQAHVAFLYSLYVDPLSRKKHVGSYLLNEILTKIKAKNIECLYLSYITGNEAAKHFYRKFGFHRCGIRPRSAKWQGEYQDEVEMVYFTK